jgi:hypothetical protein
LKSFENKNNEEFHIEYSYQFNRGKTLFKDFLNGKFDLISLLATILINDGHMSDNFAKKAGRLAINGETPFELKNAT